MRLIDADELINILEWNKGRKEDIITSANSVITLIKSRPTAYDVDKVVERIHKIGISFCDNVKCNKDCKDCEHGCIMRAVEGEVKEGGVNDSSNN